MEQGYKSESILHKLAKKDNRFINDSKRKEIVNILYSQNRRQKANAGKQDTEQT